MTPLQEWSSWMRDVILGAQRVLDDQAFSVFLEILAATVSKIYAERLGVEWERAR